MSLETIGRAQPNRILAGVDCGSLAGVRRSKNCFSEGTPDRGFVDLTEQGRVFLCDRHVQGVLRGRHYRWSAYCSLDLACLRPVLHGTMAEFRVHGLVPQ